MNRLNPIYIGILLIIILGFVFFKLNGAKVEYTQAKASYRQTSLVANELSGLKSVYTDKGRVKNSLQKILKHTILRTANIEQKIKKSGISISSKSINMKSVNFLMGKILNGTYQISAMKIKKLSETKVSLELEIKW